MTPPPIRFGLQTATENVTWPALLEVWKFAEDLGYDTIWTTEHHFAEDGWSPSLLPILSAIAARTSTVRLGTFIIVLPFHHPVRVAEDAATVDIISNGRLDLGVGQGYWLSEFASFGVSRKQRASRLTEGVDIINKCFTEENFSYDGKYWKLEDIELSPRSIQQANPPIWVAAMAENSVRRVARLGYHLAGKCLLPDVVPVGGHYLV